jgi:hypothetical protein
MFNYGVEMGRREDLSIFTRLLAEAVVKSFQAYEDALWVLLLPTVERTFEYWQGPGLFWCHC